MKKIILFLFITLLFACDGEKRQKTESPANESQPEVIEAEIEFKPNNVFSLTFILNDSIYVIGKLPLKDTIYLLNNEDGSTWECSTVGHREYFEEINWLLTRISPQPPADQRFDIAYVDEPLQTYQTIQKESITNDKQISRYDSLIKNARLIESLFSQENAFFPDSVISTQTPSVISVVIPGRQVHIIDYSFYQRFAGPRFLLLDNKIFPLTGPCSYEFLFPYLLNGKYYIQTGSTCCDCGWVIDQIFEVAEDSVYLVFQDDSYST